MGDQIIKPLVLHAHGTGPNPYKVAVILEALGLPYVVKVWQFGDDPKSGLKGKNFLAINENGRVPALEDPNTGVVSWESGAVINYLLRVYDKHNDLGPRGDSEQDRVDFDKWIFFLVSTLGPMVGQLNWFKHYHATKNEDAQKRYEEQSYRALGVLEGQIAKSGSGFIMPKSFTAVDAHFYPWLYQTDYHQLDLDKYPNTKKWMGTVAAMQQVKKAYEKIPAGEKM